MPSTNKRGTLCKDGTQINIRITWEHIWDSHPVYIQINLYAQIKFKNHKQIMKEQSETGWEKKNFDKYFHGPFSTETTTLAESWNKVRTCKNIYYYPKNSEHPVTQKNLSNRHGFTEI